MVKLFAPAMSLDATGTVAGAMTFSKWKGRSYLRKTSTPANPRSALQISTRAVFQFLTSNWNTLSAAEKLTWQDQATELQASAFNAYLAHNTQRWQLFKPPTKAYPAAENGDVAGYGDGEPEAQDSRQSIKINWYFEDDPEDNWGIAIFKGTEPFDPARANLVAMRLADVQTTPQQ